MQVRQGWKHHPKSEASSALQGAEPALLSQRKLLQWAI
jgi:hypothetical protein